MYYVYTPDYKTFELHDATAALNGRPPPTITDARLMNGVLNGDLVTYDDMSERPFTVIRRAKHPHLAGLLELTSKTLYGMTSRHVPIYLFHPFDRRYPPFRVGCSEKDRSVNKIAIISVDSFEAGQTFPRGQLVEILGVAGDLAVERLALQHVASPFYKKKFAKLMDLPAASPGPSDLRPTYDAGWHIFNIDPAGCKDIDDVIGLREEGAGQWRCIIGIADVDAHISAGSQLDEYAAHTLQTIYDDGAAVRPMLPPLYSEGLCSLRPGHFHKVLAYEFTFSTAAAVAEVSEGNFKTLNVMNHASYTYESVLELEDRPSLSALRQLVGQLGGDVTDTHDWVAILMKHYNIQAAKRLLAAGAGILRTHSGPKMERIREYETILGPTVAQQLGNEAAKYESVDRTALQSHYSIGTAYCHATSPIRRYADLVNQRILKGIVANCTAELIYNLNIRSKAARQYDRIAFFLSQIEDSKTVDLIVVNERRAYVSAWKMLVRFTSTLEPGTKVTARLYYDASQPSWKNKIIFKAISSINI